MTRQSLCSPTRSAARPGSALILTIVCLVMMVLLGTSYVQIARIDRRATRQLTSVDNSVSVRDAVIAYVAKVLKEDVISPAGIMFDAATYSESYDYPFSNRDVSYPVVSGRPDRVGTSAFESPAPHNAAGGQWDDTWLASTYLDEESREETSWSHISNLNGIYVRLPKSSGGQAMPQEVVTLNQQNYPRSPSGPLTIDGFGEVFMTTNDNWDYAVFLKPSLNDDYRMGYTGDANYAEYGYDCDGDGILDSRWTWAPTEVRQIGSVTYVVAYRIIDLSSMVNLNVATEITNATSGAAALAEAPLGSYPTDLNLARLFASKAGAWKSEMNAANTVRGLPSTSSGSPMLPGVPNLTINPSYPAGYTGATHRAGAWHDANVGAKYYGFANNKFGLDSELELRALNGLNTTTVAPIETAMPTMLRRDATGETAFNNVAGVTGNTNTRLHSYFQGTTGSINQGADVWGRAYPEVRHMLTTFSGTSIFAPRPNASFGTAERLQYDLVTQHNPETQGAARVVAIQDRLNKIFSIGTPMYLGYTDTNLINQVAGEFALAIQDYSDTDNTPSKLTIGSVDYYGLELMPFLREVYVQAGFKGDGNDADMDMINDKWILEPGSGACVIEIGNPFAKPVKCDSSNMGLEFRVVMKQGGAELFNYAIPTGTGDLPPREVSGAPEQKEQLILFSNAQTPIDEGGKGADLVADLSLATPYPNTGGANGQVRLDMGAGKLNAWTPNGSDISVELQANIGGTWVTYDRLTVNGFAIPTEFSPGTGDPAMPPKAHAQRAMYRDGTKTRYISNKGKTKATDRNPDGGGYQANGVLSKLGLDTKGATGDANLDKVQIAHANHQIFNVAELGYIFMFGFSNAADGDFPARLSGTDGNGTGNALKVARQFLSFSNENGSGWVVPNSTKVPHAAMIFDHFTTLSPRYDGVDNDDEDQDGFVGIADNPEEQFVPGRMNVNTTPAWLLALTSPLPEYTADLSQLSRAIVDYRDGPDTGTTQTGGISGLRIDNEQNKGIQSIGELLLVAQRHPQAPGGVANNRDVTYLAKDGTPLAASDPRRLTPHPNDTTAQAYNEEYPAQERMARFQFMTNNLTTRSDRFCAYITIRGYNSTDFRLAPSESMKFFVIYDRSGIVDVNSSVNWFPKDGQDQ